jgi:hypothetical protein
MAFISHVQQVMDWMTFQLLISKCVLDGRGNIDVTDSMAVKMRFIWMLLAVALLLANFATCNSTKESLVNQTSTEYLASLSHKRQCPKGQKRVISKCVNI